MPVCSTLLMFEIKKVIQKHTNSVIVTASFTNNVEVWIVMECDWMCIKLYILKDELSLKNTKTRSSVLHSHTVLMKLIPCGRYRQLNSVQYPNNQHRFLH